MASVPNDALNISPDGRSAVLELNDIPVIDQPTWPAHDAPFTPARMSFKVVWKATGEPAYYEDKLKHFRFEGFHAQAQVEASVEVPTLKFAWRSDPLSTSKAAFAIIGSEVNGKYYQG